MIKTRFATVSWRNSVAFRSKTRNTSPLRKVRVKRYWFGTVVVPLPVKPWEIASPARRNSKKFLGWSRIQILHLTRVESSLVGSVQKKSSRISPSSSDTGRYLTIKYSRLMGAVTFLYFLIPWSVCGYFSLTWCLGMPGILFLDEGNV